MAISSEAARPRRLMFDAALIARWHTILSFSAFLSALFLGCALHYKNIVKNGVAGYPEEWFPSVSATIGDWYPERNIFQILIAVTSGPRFALVLMQYYLHRSTTSSLPGFVMLTGILRTFSCGGWVYITSTDDHDAHDVLMIGYIALNVPWMFGTIACTPSQQMQAQRRRRLMSTTFFVAMIPMIYFFIQHKVYRIPGAYTRYSFFEWGLIFFDIMFDSAAEIELRASKLQIAVGTMLNSGPEANDISESPEKAQIADVFVNDKSLQQSSLDKPIQNTEVNVIRLTQQQKISRFALLETFRLIASFASDLYLSFVYWSIFTSLMPTLFYFSVWALEIAGQELTLLSTLSPVLLGVSPFAQWCRSRPGRTILHLLSLAGLAAYALNSPLQRLWAVAFAAAVANIGAAVDWTEGDALYQGILVGLGFLLSSVAKHANHANIPIWPIVNEASGGYNKTGIVLTCLAIYESSTRPVGNSLLSSSQRTPERGEATPCANSSWFGNGLSLGSLIFTLHCFLADSSTTIVWAWTGYPAIGLCVPVLLGSLSTKALDVLLHPLWFLYGSCSAYVMYSYRDWLGYAGGLNFTIFLMSIIPAVLQNAASRSTLAKTFFTAWLVVCIFYVANVFTVAYAFVPGGIYFRERTDLVLIAQMAALALTISWPWSKFQSATQTLARPARSAFLSAIAVLSILSLLVTMYRWPTTVIRPHKPAARLVRAGIWTVHFGIDNDGRDSQRRIRDLVKDMELDVVGLLESDLHRTAFGNRDLARVMVEELGFYVDIGPGPNSHTWGAALLSKFPIINSTHHLLPSPDGELAPAIEAVLDMYGTEVTVIVSHNGQEETALDRELQAAELARIMAKSYPQPVIFLGYVVTKPLALKPAPYEIMVADGLVHDIDEQDWDRWCEYIFYRGLYRTSYARVSRSTITDTEMQIGQFVVPYRGKELINESKDARYLRAWKEELPEDHWLPMEYYSELGGKRGHFYHVFNTPLYYKLPEDVIIP